MIIQHILTEDIFNTIFDETQFHRENNIARELETVIHTFFTGETRRVALSSIKHYYDAINAAAAGIADHHEKQKFLKVVYETFYKSYNPKAADRLGVVYTPNEIVRFMIESTDYLLHQHFNKYLEDKNVEILDPATGTGTFICDIIDYLRKEKVEYKYRNELHANEVAILPYYISNLNIEFTYTQKMGKYAEFENLCFVDTLDNLGFAFTGKQIDMFAPFTEENSKRIKKQNSKRIAVIIGNPPYNANQANENDNNKNREYPEIDKRIKDSFIKYSTAQKTKVYDMYARFYRWAFDRLDNNGVIAFITNRSFIDSRTFDGFRKTIQNEFDAAYIIDTKSDVRANPKIAGTTHNVFGIQTGVAIMFLIKKLKRENTTCKIHYTVLDDFWKKEKKLQWLSENPLRQIPFEIIRPDKKNNWINIADNDFESLMPMENSNNPQRQLFSLISNGINTARDEWVFSLNKENLLNKVDYFIGKYNGQVNSNNIEDGNLDYSIKWSEALKNHFQKKQLISFDNKLIREFSYRPFYKQFYYAEKKMSDRLTSNHYDIFGKDLQSYNLVIPFSGRNCSKPFTTLATQRLFGFDYLEKTQCLPLFRYDSVGKQIDNISNWALINSPNSTAKKVSLKNLFFIMFMPYCITRLTGKSMNSI
jgi:predicted helicase